MKTKQIASEHTLKVICFIFIWMILLPSMYFQVGPFMPCWEKMAHSALENSENVSGNRTIQEVLNFLNNDTTNDNEYTEDYDCKHFSCDLIRNAMKEGFKCGYVSIRYGCPPGHGIVVFDTDSGFLFVDPQADDIYFNLRNSFNGKKITDIEILWE